MKMFSPTFLKRLLSALLCLSSASHAEVGKPDFNGDGRADILWQHAGQGFLIMWFMNGTSLNSQAALSFPQVTDINWQIVGAADFNGDGKSDILWQHAIAGDLAMWFMDGPVMVSQSGLSPNPQIPDTAWKIAGTGDFNKDGKADILWRNVVAGQDLVWFMNGPTMTSQAELTPFNPVFAVWQISVTGDFNGDGNADVLWRHSQSGLLVVWFMDGVSVSSQEVLSPISSIPDLNWQISGCADFNSDGKSDLIWQHSITGQIVIWLMNGATITAQTSTAPFNTTDTQWRVRNR